MKAKKIILIQERAERKYLNFRMLFILSIFGLYLFSSVAANAQTMPKVGGELMYPTEDIVSKP